MGDLLVAAFAPIVEIVGAGRLEPLWIDRIGADQFEGLARARVHAEVVGSGDVDVAVVIGKDGTLLVGIDVDPEIRRPGNRAAAARGLYIEGLAVPKAEGANMQRTLGGSKGDVARTEIDKCDVGTGTDAHIGPAYLDFGASVGIGEDAIAGADRIVEVGLSPVLGTGRLNGDCAVDDGQPSGLRGRIVILSRGGKGEDRETGRNGNCHEGISAGKNLQHGSVPFIFCRLRCLNSNHEQTGPTGKWNPLRLNSEVSSRKGSKLSEMLTLLQVESGN